MDGMAQALRNILEIIRDSRDDEVPVFDAILEQAARLCHAEASGLQLLNDAGTHAVYVRGWGGESLWFKPGYEMAMDGPNKVPEAIRTAKVINIEDLKDTDLYREGYAPRRALVEKEGIRSWLIVPLLKDGKGFGCLTLSRHRVDRFSDDDIALVETFAAQAAIAIENVRQYRELQSRLDREASTRRILDVISRSRDDDRPVFDAILENAARLCRAPYGFMGIVNDARTHLTVRAHIGARTRFLESDAALRTPIDRRLIAGRAVIDKVAIRQDDLADDDLYREGEPFRVQSVDLEGVRSVIAVPLISDGEGIGILMLYRREVAPFSDDDVTLVENFAAQAVIAIENVRQFREVQERLSRERASVEVLEVISQSRHDEAPVFEAILSNACSLCNAPLAGLILGTPDDDIQTLAAHRGMFPSAVELFETGQMRMDGNLSYAARSIIEGRLIAFDDMAESELYQAGSPVVRSMVDASNIRSVLFVPLIKDGSAIGNLTLFRREISPFNRSEISLVQTFAAQAVIAIDNVRQFREVKQRLERERASREILQVISESREDETPTFHVILENAAGLCGAVRARLMLTNSENTKLTIVATWGQPNPTMPEGMVIDMEQDLIPVRAVREKQVYNVADAHESRGYKSGNPLSVKTTDGSNTRSVLAVPLINDKDVLGCIAISDPKIGAFDDTDVLLVQTFATQAVIAIENVRQFREVQARLEREEASRQILQVISASRTDATPVFDRILEYAAHLSGAPFANLCLLNDARSHWHLVAHYGDDLRHLTVGQTATSLDSELAPAVSIRTGQIVQIEDLTDTDLYRQGDPGRVTMVEVEGMRTILCVPLLSEAGAIGCITLFRREVNAFTNDEVALVETFAAQAVIAIENVRQFNALESLNAELGDRVEKQVGEIERMGKLKRFLPAAVADTVVSQGADQMLSSHRALLGVLFCDIRGFTAFCETAEPEETIEVLQTYHEEMGKLIANHSAGVDHRMGDGIMVLFNDPLPCEDPAGDAVRLAIAMRSRMEDLCAGWKRMGHRLGFGVGISLGYATVGMVGYEGRYDYTASGTAVNLAARLCDQANDGEILLSPRAQIAVEDSFKTESTGDVQLRGIQNPTEVFRLVGGL